mgnify:CR=1 FL=1
MIILELDLPMKVIKYLHSQLNCHLERGDDFLALIDRLRHDFHPITKRRLQPAGLIGIEHAIHLRLAVLQREVVMARGISLIARDLPRHLQRPHPVQMPFQDIR